MSGCRTLHRLLKVYLQYTGSGLVIYPIMVYYWCFDMVPIPCAFKVYQRFTQKVNYQ